MDKKFLSVKDIDCYKSAFDLSNKIWALVAKWSYFEKDTIGKQFVRSIDWLDKAKARKIINDAQYLEIKREIENLPKQINQLIKYTNLALKD